MRLLADEQRGTSTLEVIAALILFSLAAAGLAVVLPLAYERASLWRDQYNVARHLEQHLETLRGQAYNVNVGEQTTTEEGLSCHIQTIYVKESADGQGWVAPQASSGDGLFATYYNNEDFTGSRYSRIDPNINFDKWGTGSPVSGIGADTFSVRWTGWVEPPATGSYTFITDTDDGTRLWVNEQLVIDRWNSSGSYSSSSVALNANQKYSIKMEYYDKNGPAKAILKWSGPGINQQVIPQQRLYSSLAKLTTVTITNAVGSVSETGKLLTFHNNLATNTGKIMYVADINMYRWLWIFLRVSVTVYDENNNPLSGVTVNGQIDFHSILGYDWNQSVSAVTGSNGVAVIDVVSLASSATFTVTNLTKNEGGYIYDPTRNRESEESI